MTVYGPRCNVHPDRDGVVKTQGPNRLLVVHTSEGSEGPNSAENLCGYLQSPGDQTSSTGSVFGASYHYITDTDRVLPVVPDNVVAYAAAGANHDGIHVCIPGKAAQTRASWLDAISRSYLHRCAEVLVDKSIEHGIPLTRLNVAQIQAGSWGYCGHYDISRAYHLSSHTDPGPEFPWDVLAQDIRDLTASPGEDMELHRVPPRIYVTDPADKAQPNTVVDPSGAFGAGTVRKVKTPLTGLRQAKVQVTVRPIDPNGFVRVGPGDVALPSGVHSNINWSAGQPESSPVDVLLDGNGDTFAVYASARCHVLVDWLGWLV